MIFYLVPEPFSAFAGLALSSVTANMMRFTDDSVVVCPAADPTWGFDPHRSMVIPHSRVANIRGWQHVPLSLRRVVFERVFRSFLTRLRAGDTVWFLNWPNVAEGLGDAIRSRGARLVFHAQNSLADRAARTGMRNLKADAYIFNSEVMRKEVLDRVPNLRNTYAVHNGADENKFFPETPEKRTVRPVPVVLFVGRLVEIKGVHVLTEAMKHLEQRGVAATCRVVGSPHAGKDQSKATPYVYSLRQNAPATVVFAGFRSATQIAEEYRNADIFCCPSIWREPFGSVNIEAMASGLPVVASRVGGIPEIASEGGIVLVEPGSPQELADALQALIENPGWRQQVASQGIRSFRKRFTWAAIVRQLQKILASLSEEAHS